MWPGVCAELLEVPLSAAPFSQNVGKGGLEKGGALHGGFGGFGGLQ